MYELANTINCGLESPADRQHEVFERLGRWDDAIYVADLTREQAPFNPFAQVDCALVTARCLAAQGEVGTARHHFDQAIAEARRARLYFAEMFCIRDCWASDCDRGTSAGATGPAPLVALGRAVESLSAKQLTTYTSLLGHGIDAEKALAAYAESSA